MLKSVTSRARDSERPDQASASQNEDPARSLPSRANLLAAYIPLVGRPSNPATEVIFTMVPVLSPENGENRADQTKGPEEVSGELVLGFFLAISKCQTKYSSQRNMGIPDILYSA
jgi:hypothetical protein